MRYEIAYYDKRTGQREFEDCRSEKSANNKIARLVKNGTIDTTKDYALMKFDEDGDLV